MDLHSCPQPESGKLEQIVSQFLLKILHVILLSRIPSLHQHELASGSRLRRSDKWFNLVLGDRPAALDNLNFWQTSLIDPMIIDIILVHQPPTSLSTPTIETLIERWAVQYESPRGMPPTQQTADTSSSYKKTYKKSIILLRSLYSQMRLLPAHRLFRQLNSSIQNSNFDIIYKVSSFTDPFSRAEDQTMKEYLFVPVEAFPGRLSVSVTYRPTLSDFNLELSTSLPPKIITDYVGSPSTDPMRSFPSSDKVDRATSFPLRGIRPPVSAPFQRPHSWSSGFHKAPPITHLTGSPPVYRTPPMPCDFPSSPTDNYGYRLHNHRPFIHQKATGYDEYQLSPPFSPYASPSPPTPMQTRLRSETAPVTIPLPVTSRSSRYFSPNSSDPNRHSLPPLSPRSAKHDPSSQESPSGNRLYRRAESLRTAELHSGANAMNHYSGHKMIKDSKDDSGRFSGLLSSSGSPRVGFSRSSSRLSFQDDMEYCDFSCPFDVDDVDVSDSSSSQNLYGKKASESLSMGTKSQDAAVGVLVHMLRTAPPLRQDPSCYSSHSMRTEVEEGVSTSSGFFMPRRTVDALEELKSYREMKDLLLSRSGTHAISRE
ncbi:hypothetical protein Ddye_029209 [Dipteronia dyeriana]|uniref:Autophagy-related protein 13 N-terminal domain-containing protein n=1 Tax=Dipteronia dyeriana TaxID=168575 RepID=A0AAD9TE57_9ROSI|nr:hypothetical protein Ddye_029209 [Dipteronia dyeriana]